MNQIYIGQIYIYLSTDTGLYDTHLVHRIHAANAKNRAKQGSNIGSNIYSEYFREIDASYVISLYIYIYIYNIALRSTNLKLFRRSTNFFNTRF